MNQVAKNILTTIYQFSKAVTSANDQHVDWGIRPSPGKWSKKEIIGHLCDSAMINLQRFVRCTYEESFKLVYEQEEWVQAQRYQDMDIDQLLQLWKLLNLQIIQVLDHYPPDRLQAKCDNSKNEVSLHTVEWLAQDYLDHMQHHLSQIRLNEPVN